MKTSTSTSLRAILCFAFSIAALVAVCYGAPLIAAALWVAVWLFTGGSKA